MKKIASFCVNHDTLKKGMYLSRIDGDISTWDIRMCLPNSGNYLDMSTCHSFEHLFATIARNSLWHQQIIYIGPMGCRTGFYFLTRNMTAAEALDLFRDILQQIASYNGDIPGSSRQECGNYLEHDLNGAKKIAADMAKVLADWTAEKMQY